MITLTLVVNQKVTLTINPQSFSGKQGQIKNISWKLVSGDSTLEPSADGTTAIITASSKPRVTVFLVGADTHMNMAKPKMNKIALSQSVSPSPTGYVYNHDGYIYNHVSVQVVQTRTDSTHDRTATNLGLYAGSPRD